MPTDKEKDFESAFNSAYDYWYPWIEEAHTDFKHAIDNPMTEADRQKLRDENREILHFPVLRRIVKLITGYERRNRLTLKIGPAEGSDDRVAGQLTGIVMPLMENHRGHEVVSDAFEMGSLIAGANLIEPYFDRRGDIQFARKFYNKFLLDPNFTRRDLKDSRYLIIHEPDMAAEAIKSLIPKPSTGIDEILKSPESGTKLPFGATYSRGDEDKGTLSYFWERTTKKVDVVGNTQTGQTFIWTASKKELKKILGRYKGNLKNWSDYQETVKLCILVNGQEVWSGDDPNGIDDYPYVFMCGYFYPEYDNAAVKIQGIIRPLRDCGREVDKRLSKILDIIDSQVQTGMISEEGALVDPNDIHASGQGRGIWVKQGQFGKVEKIQSGDIPPGLFQLNNDLQGLLNQIAGINESMFGTEELKAQMSGYLLKLRQGAGLVSLSDLFDHKGDTLKQLGFKLIKMVQANYSRAKVQRILNEPVAPDFYTDDLARYDLVPQEGILTSTQQQMFYAELRQAKTEGAPIPWKVVFENAPIQMKQKLLDAIDQAEKEQQAAQQEALKEKQLLDQMRTAKINADNARAEERTANVQEHHADAAFARVKTMKELAQMDHQKQMDLLDRLIALENIKHKGSLTKR